jgi:DsbC/DsbD-like thiol-disulfide interchange protein
MNWPAIPLLLSALLVVPAAATTSGEPLVDTVTADAVTVGVVTVRLMPDTTRWVPGRSHLVGVHFEMEQGWHLYWPGQNDSGLAIQLEPQVQDGLTTGALRWPAPERLVHPGDLVDHVYQDKVTLLLPVTVPDDAEPGTRLTLRVDADWLVCMEACLPGAAEVSLSMTVAGPNELPARSEDADQLGAVLARIPGSPSKDTTIEEVEADGTYRITVPKAARLAFYPAEGSLPLVDIAASCAALGPRLVIHRDPDPPHRPEADGPARLRGILEVWYNANTPSQLSIVDVDPPPPTPGEGEER